MASDIVGDLVELLFWGGFYVASNRNKTRKPVKPVEPIHIEEDSSPKTPLEEYWSSICSIDLCSNYVAPFCYYIFAAIPAAGFFGSYGTSFIDGTLFTLFTTVFISTEVYCLIKFYTLKRKFLAKASPEEIALFNNNKKRLQERMHCILWQ